MASHFGFDKLLNKAKKGNEYSEAERVSGIEFAAECQFTKPWRAQIMTDLIGKW